MLAVGLLLVLLGGWELFADLGGVDDFLLPAPSQIASALYDDRAILWHNLTVTAWEVLLGILAALVAALVLAAAIHASRTLRRAVYPLLVASQTIPIVIVAPLLVAWLGYDIAPKLAIIALICFFPVVVSALDGLWRVDPDCSSSCAHSTPRAGSPSGAWRRPSALPALFSGAKIAVTVAVIGAVLAEQAGSSDGLGHLMLQAIPQLETARAYAAGSPRRARHRPLRGPDPDGAPRRPVGRTATRNARILALLAAALLALGLAACGEKKDSSWPRGSADPSSSCSTTFPTPTTSASTRRSPTATSRRPASTSLRAPSDPSAPLKLLAAGKADLAISYEPELLLARDKGAEPGLRWRHRPGAADLDHLPRDKEIRTPADLAARTSAPPASPTSRPT